MTTAEAGGRIVPSTGNPVTKSGMPRSVSRAGSRADRVTISGTEASTSTGGSPQCRYRKCTHRAVHGGHCRVHSEAHARWRAGGFTDAAPVRAHVRALLDAGLSIRAIHCVTGVDHRVLAHLVVGSPQTGTWPQGRIPAAEARHILELPTPAQTGATEVPAVGSIRRLRALFSLGHDADSLGQKLDLPAGDVWQIMTGDPTVIAVGLARRVAAVFDEWQMRPGQNRECRDAAATRGWAPPLAWDELSIDNPAAEPDRGRRRQVLFDEIYCELRAMGLHREAIAARLGISMDSLYRQLLRYGMSGSEVRP